MKYSPQYHVFPALFHVISQKNELQYIHVCTKAINILYVMVHLLQQSQFSVLSGDLD